MNPAIGAETRSPSAWTYTNLYNAITTKASPLRGYLDETFSNRRAVQDEYRAACGGIQVAGALGLSPGTVGTAFDTLIKLRLTGGHAPRAVIVGAARIAYLVGSQIGTEISLQDGLVASVLDAHDRYGGDAKRLCHLAWLDAWCTEASRAPVVNETFAAALVASGGSVSTELLMGLVPDIAVNELNALDRLADQHLYPQLGPQPLCEPQFHGSKLCRADADLIADHSLIEVKATLGRKATGGDRRAVLTSEYINQMVAYALFDTHDEYGLHSVALYSARFGYYVQWPLVGLLSHLAGRAVDLELERAHVWELLGGDAGLALKVAASAASS